MVNYKWKTVAVRDLGLEPVDWLDVNDLCQQGWEVSHTYVHRGGFDTMTVVYLRNPVGFYTHTKTCPTCNREKE